MDISIIIPVYNVEEYITDCISSVMNQNDIDTLHVECIIVDDCSPDRSMDLAEERLARYEGSVEFRLIHREKNGGLSAARNSGIREAKGRYLFFLDSDDTISPDCISSLYGYVLKYPGVNIVYGQTVCTPDPSVQESFFDLKGKGAIEYCDDIDLIRQQYLSFPEIACNRLINSNWLTKHNLYFKEGILHEDFHWHLMAYQYVGSYSFAGNQAPTYYYLKRPGSISDQSQNEKRLKTKALIFQDFAKANALWNKPIMSKLLSEFNLYRGFFNASEPLSSWARGAYRQLIANLWGNRTISRMKKLPIAYLRLPSFLIADSIARFIIDRTYKC